MNLRLGLLFLLLLDLLLLDLDSFLNRLIEAHVRVKLELGIRAGLAVTNKTLSLPPGQGLELRLLILLLGLGRALEVVVVDAVHRDDEGRLGLLRLGVREAGVAIIRAIAVTLLMLHNSPLC